MTNEAHIFAVPATDLSITRRDIEHALGYTDSAAPEFLPEMIDEALAAAEPLVNVRCGFRIYSGGDVTISRDDVVCGHVRFNTGRIIATRLRRSSSLAIFAATIGKELETVSRRLMDEGDMMAGFIYDTIASAYAEATAEWIEERIATAAAAENEKNTNRYSPGYCDWRVAEQHALFSLLPQGFLGITLTPSALMLPIKSVSGIIGIGAEVKHEQYQCSVCDMHDCIRKKLTESHIHPSH